MRKDFKIRMVNYKPLSYIWLSIYHRAVVVAWLILLDGLWIGATVNFGKVLNSLLLVRRLNITCNGNYHSCSGSVVPARSSNFPLAESEINRLFQPLINWSAVGLTAVIIHL